MHVATGELVDDIIDANVVGANDTFVEIDCRTTMMTIPFGLVVAVFVAVAADAAGIVSMRTVIILVVVFSQAAADAQWHQQMLLLWWWRR